MVSWGFVLENLVPNITAELYFVAQLLTVKGWRQACKQEGSEKQEESQAAITGEYTARPLEHEVGWIKSSCFLYPDDEEFPRGTRSPFQ